MDKNFDDIILDNNNKSERVKKLLLRVIALVILFLVVMIVMKLLNSGDENKGSQTLFPAEPNTSSEFDNIPISNEPNSNELDEFTALKLQMQGFESNVSVLESNQSFAMPLPSSEYNASAPAEPAVAPKPADKPKVAQNSATKPKAENKPATQKPKAESKPATQKPKAEPKPAQKPADKPKVAQNSAQNASDLQSGAYVQVFSVKNFDTKSRELALVTQNGYKYSTRKRGETTQILIGPFSQDELNAELPKIRQTISKDAFVVQVK